MKLVASLTSPFARKVRILLLEKQIPFELVVDIPWNSDTQVPLHNPLGKVPVLVLESGETVYDSRVIAAYLETLPGRKFIPQDDVARIAVLRLEALADGIADAAAAVFIERKRPPVQVSDDWIDRQMLKIQRGLAGLSAWLGSRMYFVGDDVTLAEIAAVSSLGYLDFRFPELDWRQSHPALANMALRMELRVSVQQTQPVA